MGDGLGRRSLDRRRSAIEVLAAEVPPVDIVRAETPAGFRLSREDPEGRVAAERLLRGMDVSCVDGWHGTEKAGRAGVQRRARAQEGLEIRRAQEGGSGEPGPARLPCGGAGVRKPPAPLAQGLGRDVRSRGARSAGPSIRSSGKVKTTRRSAFGDFGRSRLALRHRVSDRGRGCYPSVPRGKVAPPFTGAALPPPQGAEPAIPGRSVPSGPGPQGCPWFPARTSPASRKAGGNTPDLRSPSPSAGP